MKYTDGRGKVFDGKDLQKEVWNWYRFLKANGHLYPMLKADYLKSMGIEEMKEG